MPAQTDPSRLLLSQGHLRIRPHAASTHLPLEGEVAAKRRVGVTNGKR